MSKKPRITIKVRETGGTSALARFTIGYGCYTCEGSLYVYENKMHFSLWDYKRATFVDEWIGESDLLRVFKYIKFKMRAMNIGRPM